MNPSNQDLPHHNHLMNNILNQMDLKIVELRYVHLINLILLNKYTDFRFSVKVASKLHTFSWKLQMMKMIWSMLIQTWSRPNWQTFLHFYSFTN